MTDSLHALLAGDHARLDVQLARAGQGDPEEYRAFRAGLLRHIAIEEKVLFVDARARRGGVALPIVDVLHADHAALASLLVPPPTPALLRTIREILDEHNPLEEAPGGLYEQCEQLAGDDVAALLARAYAIPPVRTSEHVDEPRIHAHIARMLAARARRP